MNIVKGRGKNRTVIELPCGELIAASAKANPETYRQNVSLMCQILGVRENA